MELPVGLVLAGGRGRRIGQPKGQVRVAGCTLAERAAATLAAVCRGVVISVAPGSPNPAPGFPAVEDEPPAGRGPLAGIHAAFRVAGRTDLLVLACDYPDVSAELLGGLLDCAAREPAAHVVILTDIVRGDQPLVGLWRRRAAVPVAAALAAGDCAVLRLLARLPVLRLGAAELPGFDLGRMLVNVNEPDDLAPYLD